MQLTEKVERLKAIQEEERVKWEMRIAQSETENATLKVNVNLFLVRLSIRDVHCIHCLMCLYEA